MTTEDLKPLDKDILELLDAERPVESAPIEVKKAVLRSVLPHIGSGGGNHGDPGGSPDGLDSAAQSASSGLLRSWIVRHGLPIVGAFTLGGAVVGTVVARYRSPSPPQVIYVDRVQSASAAPVEPPPLIATELPLPAVRPSSAAVPASRSAESTPRLPGDLAAERMLLDEARAAIANGRSDKALRAIGKHAEAFPHGLLAEEREALAVRALVMAGQPDSARARGDQFRTQYPNSVMRRAVESSLESISSDGVNGNAGASPSHK